MKNIALLASLSLTSLASAATVINVDFNTSDGNAGAGWNVFADTSDISTTPASTALDDNADASTDYTLSATGTFDDSTGANMIGATPPSWVSAEAGDDFFWTDSGGNSEFFTLTYGGFTIGDKIDLDIFSSRDSATFSVGGTFEYSLDGGSTWSGFQVLTSAGVLETADGWTGEDTQSKDFSLITDGYDNGRYMNIEGITLTGTTLQVKATELASGNTYTGINAMRLTVIPEPSTYTLLAGLLGLCSVMLRRRK